MKAGRPGESRELPKVQEAPRPSWWRGLSGKVLVLTVLFVMIGEVLIFLPSIASFRIAWLKERVATAEIAALAARAAPGGQVSDALRQELLKGAKVRIIALTRDDARELMLRDEGDLMIDQAYDIRHRLRLQWILDAFVSIFSSGNRLIGVIDVPPNMSGNLIEIALDEAPLRKAMFAYAGNILVLSIILSLIVATLVFVALNAVLVRPIRRITMNMLDFSSNPEDPARIISPTGRRDEIGLAERELGNMQSELASMLNQKSRLAALGLAVSKVSHDLRNMLASAQLISDRLSKLNDPTVQKFAPKLIASLDRAIEFCVQTLKFGRAEEAPPRRERQPLRPLIEEIIESTALVAPSRIVLFNDVPAELIIDADRDHIFRILINLARNAVEALEADLGGPANSEGVVRLGAHRSELTVFITVKDNGPGIPQKARDHLFEAFQGSARAGGTGLGLAIASELARAHGGEIKLVQSTSAGTEFWVVIPDRLAPLEVGRRGERVDHSAA
ncbi:MAG TPA: HAMP domain-containing sensor histidine kinase [Aestuariivirgaceae bacterium]|jgi:signal transduction histidine kinase